MSDARLLEALGEHAGLGIALVDRDGVTRQVNAALAGMLEVSAEELVGRPLSALVHEDGSGERRYRRAGGSFLAVRETVASLAGDERLVLLEGLAPPEDSSTAERCLAHLGAMAAAVAHELRNALAGIGSAVEVMGQGFPVGSEERLAVEEIRRRIVGLSGMARELVAVAPARAPRRSSVSARALLGEVARLLGATDTLEIEGDDTTLHADAELLTSALVHLAGGIGPPLRLHVRARAGAVELRLEGVEESAAARGLPGFVTDRSRSAELGRSVARLVVEAHGGTLEVEPGAIAVSFPRGRAGC